MAAFRATYSDFKLIKTRQSVQIVFEIPLQDVDAALEVLGGMPNPANEAWFGIAPLVTPAAKEAAATLQPNSPRGGGSQTKTDWRDVQPTAQAGIRCADPIFHAYLKENYSADWGALEGDAAEVVRFLCGINSRSDLSTKHAARMIWKQIDDGFQAWKAVS
jgi:hypothetical protein